MLCEPQVHSNMFEGRGMYTLNRRALAHTQRNDRGKVSVRYFKELSKLKLLTEIMPTEFRQNQMVTTES